MDLKAKLEKKQKLENKSWYGRANNVVLRYNEKKLSLWHKH